MVSLSFRFNFRFSGFLDNGKRRITCIVNNINTCKVNDKK